MPVNTRELRRRIKSIGNIRKITKAMEMIAAGKMRRAQLATLASRPYANLAWGMLESLGRARIEGYGHPFLRDVMKPGFQPSDVGKPGFEHALIVMITTNRGLCGALNTQIIQKALIPYPLSLSDERSRASYIVIGRKGQRALARQNATTISAFDAFETIPTFEGARPIAKVAMDEFIAGRASSVTLAYADFISTLKYEPRMHTILPIAANMPKSDFPGRSDFEYLFEPNPAEVLDELLPRLIELQIYQAILETLASEHSARMVAMKNASDAAGDLIQDFTLTYNSVRQAAITGELADIVGGRSALKH